MGAFSSSFNRPQFQPRQNNATTRRSGFDRPILVTGYDLAKKQILGEHKGVKYAFFVKPEVFARIELAISKKAETTKNNGKEQAPYVGHVIDEKMSSAIPVGSKAIVLNSEVIETGAGGVKSASIDRVKRIDHRKSKLLEDRIVCVTAKTVKGQLMVSHYHVFEDNGIDINDLDKLNELAKRLDVSSESYGTTMGIENEKVVRPGMGVRFVTYMPTTEFDEFTKSNVGLIINRTYNYAYVSGEADESGQVPKGTGHLLTGAEMMEIRDQYINFVNSDPSLDQMRQSVKAINADWDIKAEIQVFGVYPASQNDSNTISIGIQGTPEYEEKNKNIHMRPLYQLSHAKSYLDLDHDSLIIGTNAAVKSTLEVTADKPVEMADGSFAKMPNNWAKQLFTNGVRGDSLSLIRSATGGKLKPHQRLEIVRDNQASAGAAQAAPSTQSAYAPAPQAPARPQAYSNQASTPAPAPVQQAQAQQEQSSGDESGEGDGFFDIFNDGGENAAAPAPAAPARGPVRFSTRKTS